MSEGNGQVGLAEAFETKSLLLVQAQQLIESQDRKLAALRNELNQYLRDLDMWKTAHGSEYPLRRMTEVRQKLEEIDKL